MTDPEDFSAQQRAALAVWLLLQSPLTTREIAEKCGLTMASTRQMLGRIALVVPLRKDGGDWWVENC